MKKQSLYEKYSLKNSDFKKGDIVMVINKPTEDECIKVGWEYIWWIDNMKESIGSIFTIIDIKYGPAPHDGLYGVQLNTRDKYLDSNFDYFYPYISLMKVPKSLDVEIANKILAI